MLEHHPTSHSSGWAGSAGFQMHRYYTPTAERGVVGHQLFYTICLVYILALLRYNPISDEERPLMNADITDLRQLVQDSTLFPACQALALELKQDILYAKLSFELLNSSELNSTQVDELQHSIQRHLDRALAIMNNIFIPEILHKKIHDEG